MNEIERRFKILSLLCFEMGVLQDKMKELADKLEQGHPQAVEALTFYEEKIIEIFSS